MDTSPDSTDKQVSNAKTLRGMFHVHSHYSYDADNTIEDIAAFFKSKGYHFVCLTEHADDFNQDKMDAFLDACKENSCDDFIVIPGMEYRCTGEIHLLVIGSTTFYNAKSLFDIATRAHEGKILTVIAHPRGYEENIDPAIIDLIDGIELWNGHKDSKIIPHYHTFNIFKKFRQTNPCLIALGGSDFHRLSSYFPLDTVIPDCELKMDSILDKLKGGDFYIEGRYFKIKSPDITWLSFLLLIFARNVLVFVRTLRDTIKRKGQDLAQDT